MHQSATAPDREPSTESLSGDHHALSVHTQQRAYYKGLQEGLRGLCQTFPPSRANLAVKSASAVYKAYYGYEKSLSGDLDRLQSLQRASSQQSITSGPSQPTRGGRLGHDFLRTSSSCSTLDTLSRPSSCGPVAEIRRIFRISERLPQDWEAPESSTEQEQPAYGKQRRRHVHATAYHPYAAPLPARQSPPAQPLDNTTVVAPFETERWVTPKGSAHYAIKVSRSLKPSHDSLVSAELRITENHPVAYLEIDAIRPARTLEAASGATIALQNTSSGYLLINVAGWATQTSGHDRDAARVVETWP